MSLVYADDDSEVIVLWEREVEKVVWWRLLWLDGVWIGVAGLCGISPLYLVFLAKKREHSFFPVPVEPTHAR